MAGISSKALKQNYSENSRNTFQNQEYDGDLGLDIYEFKYRMHDPEIGRFWQVDPLASEYYYNSTYAFSENKVIAHVELEGLEAKEVNKYYFKNSAGKWQLGYSSETQVKNPHKLGNGTLYHISFDNGKNGKSDIKTLNFYERTFIEKIENFSLKNLFNTQFVVFGSGDGSAKIGGQPDYSKPIEAFNYSELKEMFELFTSHNSDVSEYSEMENKSELLEKGVDLASKVIDAANDKERKDPNAEICLSCGRNQHGDLPFVRTDRYGNIIDTIVPNNGGRKDIRPVIRNNNKIDSGGKDPNKHDSTPIEK